MIRNFKDQCKALKDYRKDKEIKVPKIRKALRAMMWSESFIYFFRRVVGIRITLLAYVVH